MGQHVCCFYETEHEQLTVAAAYIADGLRAGQQCLYAAGSADALRAFEARLGEQGIPVADVVRQGALLLRTTAEAHLLGGRFDAERMLTMLADLLESALNAGFTSLRTCGDMSWLKDPAEGADEVIVYEALVTEFFRNSRAEGMCQYDRRRLAPDVLHNATLTHPFVTFRGTHRPNHLDRSAVIAAKARPANRPSA